MSERITIVIQTGNSAFDDSPTGEIARILRELADKFEQVGVFPPSLYDINGNRVGKIQVEEIE